MNRLANLAKQHRVISPKVSNKFPLDSNATKENQSRTKITIGELILNNKWPQRQREVFKQDVAKSNCIRSRAKRRLTLVDEDDEISQDVNGKDMEQDGLNDDAIERDDGDQNDDYMTHVSFENIETEI